MACLVQAGIRPSAGCAPASENIADQVRGVPTTSGSARPVIVAPSPVASASSSKTLFWDLIAENRPGDGQSCATVAPGD
ncbi:MAG: hypothetical protein J2P21_17595 [Chloracidobacterium sp.]|nr:hypothetical protein [Chloracidobacterium sp.]